MLTRPGIRWHRVLGAAGLVVFGVCLLTGLGLWQLERRAWKLELMHKIEARYKAPIHPLPSDALRNPAAHDYERVELTGAFLRDRDTWVHAATERGSGYWVLTPLITPEGKTLLINRGFVALETPRARVQPPHGSRVTGVLRRSELEDLWPRLNHPATDLWYTRDVAAIGRARSLSAVAPFFIDADTAPDAGSGSAAGLVCPVGGLTVLHFRNAHLAYALTWFALAFIVVIAGAAHLRTELVAPGRVG